MATKQIEDMKRHMSQGNKSRKHQREKRKLSKVENDKVDPEGAESRKSSPK